jgi:hypothetical protein
MTARARVVALAFVLTALPVLGDEPPATPPLVPDPSWDAKEGEHGHVITSAAPACADLFVFEEFQKFRKAKDQDGIKKLTDAGSVSTVSGTKTCIDVSDKSPER